MSEKIKTLIVEDEPLARIGLEAYVRDVDFLTMVDTCENAIEANSAVHKYQPDLIFLDIEMPRLTGIDFLKSLQNPPMVIFTTAYPNYAIQGFELNVLDYLVKPYPFARFLKAVNKARDHFLLSQSAEIASPSLEGYFFIRADNKMERINFKDINYVEAMENYVIIYTHESRFITMMTMKSIEDSLPATHFLRIHKSFIVNHSKITTVDGNEVIIGKSKLPVSRQKKQEVMRRIMGEK